MFYWCCGCWLQGGKNKNDPIVQSYILPYDMHIVYTATLMEACVVLWSHLRDYYAWPPFKASEAFLYPYSERWRHAWRLLVVEPNCCPYFRVFTRIVNGTRRTPELSTMDKISKHWTLQFFRHQYEAYTTRDALSYRTCLSQQRLY